VLENLRKFIRRREMPTGFVDLNRFVVDLVGIVEADAQAEGIALRAQLADDLPVVSGNALQLQLVLLNVAQNAIESMRHAAHKELGITIATAAPEPGRVSVAVTDHGHGVSRQLGENIFHPFVTTKRDALGVGLAMSRTIIQSYGGSLTYHDNPAGGTVFVIELPAAEGAEKDPAQSDGDGEQRQPSRLPR